MGWLWDFWVDFRNADSILDYARLATDHMFVVAGIFFVAMLARMAIGRKLGEGSGGGKPHRADDALAKAWQSKKEIKQARLYE